MFSCVSGHHSYYVLLAVVVIIRPRCCMWLCAGDHWRRRLTVGALLSVPPPSLIPAPLLFMFACCSARLKNLPIAFIVEFNEGCFYHHLPAGQR